MAITLTVGTTSYELDINDLAKIDIALGNYMEMCDRNIASFNTFESEYCMELKIDAVTLKDKIDAALIVAWENEG